MKHLYFLLLLGTATYAQNIEFADPMFKTWLLATSTSSTGTVFARDLTGELFAVDANNDDQISIAEAQMVSYFRLSCTNCLDQNKLTSLGGIEHFVNLQSLIVDANLLTNVDLSALHALEVLMVANNLLQDFDFTGLTSLRTFSAEFNQFTSLDFSSVPTLVQLGLSYNQLLTLNVEPLPLLENLFVNNNNLTLLEFGLHPNLPVVFCMDNQLTMLDCSGLPALSDLRCQNNQLTHINLKNGTPQVSTQMYGNPNLAFICIDPEDIAPDEQYSVQYSLDVSGYTNCVVNSYCSFVPGGESYEVLSEVRFDGDSNGCSSGDSMVEAQISVSNGTQTGVFSSCQNGVFSISLPQGMHILTPSVANPQFFTVTPASITITIPGDELLVNDFCVTRNGNFQDLESAVIPLTAARPGFEASYRMVFRNNGTSAMSGHVTFEFEDELMNFVWASATAGAPQEGLLTFDYAGLQPFETRTIDLTFLINTPTDANPVTGGDDLGFDITVFPLENDEWEPDNFSALKQVVVNSFDPNDITCLEGTVVGPEIIGEYVHYIIRFENTGTFAAQNIVVKDMIDTAKFDIATLIPLDASHEFETRISAGNKVEFIFENINLPFDDANNDGHVAFKIKTKSTLVVNDTFSNAANIYFDYNFPILTDTALTVITELGRDDFEFPRYFKMYPVPASDVIRIKSDLEVSAVSIYNAIGQLLIRVSDPNLEEGIDVSGLAKGSYFIRINSEKGSSSSSFVKM